MSIPIPALAVRSAWTSPDVLKLFYDTIMTRGGVIGSCLGCEPIMGTNLHAA